MNAERLSIFTVFAVILSAHLAVHLFINYLIMPDFTSCACIVIYIGGVSISRLRSKNAILRDICGNTRVPFGPHIIQDTMFNNKTQL